MQRGAEDKPKSIPASKKSKVTSSKDNGPASKKAKVSSKAADKPAEGPVSKKTKAPSKSAAEEKAAEAPASAPSSKGLKLGDKLPKITLQDNTGSDVDVSTLAGEKGVVIFLYPKADTPGCTNQACGFRDHFAEIQELGYDVWGLSKDKPAAQQRWIDKKELNYKLLCDPDSKLIKKLGAFVLPNNTKRSHFIFEKGSGKLVDAQLGVKPVDDPGNCLKFIKQHHK
ncbi:thioredoxin-like protein [Naematelia encephala]|uniref:thioredoxin-dependent peroxiredoxin n=1 Tax=Naematelia encephala TaxID=71784 RepID=A0A1Y2AUT4_9TREE|nr:thioredoxin-like protein [Naematelia encephala]